MSNLRDSSLMRTLRTIVVLGCYLTCSRGSGAEIGTGSSVNDQKKIQAMQTARAEVPIKENRADELREQLRARLRESRAAPVQNQREVIVDTKQRVKDLRTKLIAHKDVLDEAASNIRSRNRRGAD